MMNKMNKKLGLLLILSMGTALCGVGNNHPYDGLSDDALKDEIARLNAVIEKESVELEKRKTREAILATSLKASQEESKASREVFLEVMKKNRAVSDELINKNFEDELKKADIYSGDYIKIITSEPREFLETFFGCLLFGFYAFACFNAGSNYGKTN
jgi:hypothetical protein